MPGGEGLLYKDTGKKNSETDYRYKAYSNQI